MKSKTKTILIFAAILAAVFLIAFLDGGAVQSAAEEEGEGMLIGAFVSEEDLDIDDLEVTATGKIQWKRGRLYAEKWEKSWRFPNLPDGGGFYSALRTETEGELAGSTTPQHVSFGEIKTTNMAYHVYDDNGVRTTDIDLSGEVYACGDRQVIFNLYPIYQTSDGRIYLTRGNSMGMSGSDGGSMTHTLTSDKTETIGGKSERVKVKVAITVVARRDADEVHRRAHGRKRQSFEARRVRARRTARVHHACRRRGVPDRHKLWRRLGRRDGGIRHLQP